jgi:hypothetical protein
VLRRATHLELLDKRRVLTSDDMFLALLNEDGPAKAALISLGTDPSAMRSEVMRSRPVPERGRNDTGADRLGSIQVARGHRIDAARDQADLGACAPSDLGATVEL